MSALLVPVLYICHGLQLAPFRETVWWLLLFFFTLYKHNFYWNVTFCSFCGTRLYIKAISSFTRPHRSLLLVWWPLFRYFIPLGLILWCASLTPLHLITYSPMDAWTRYAVHEPHEPYEVLYERGQNIEADVFAVHGLGSNPVSAWTYRRANGSSVRWLKDLLPYREGFGDIRITMLNHQTRWDSHAAAMTFEDHAAKLLDDIEDIHKPGVPIIFIAHSFGGLLLKKALILARHHTNEIATLTKGILFLGVPHGGTEAAYLASLLSCTAYWRGSSPALLEYMSPTGTAIFELEKDFYNAYVKHGWRETQTLPYICDFIEMREERFGPLALAPTVGIKSAGLHRHGKIVHLDADHRGLNKFGSMFDPNFRDFCRHFGIALSSAKGEAIERQYSRSRKVCKLKALSNVPFERDENFIGRKNIIAKLETIYAGKDFHNRAALVGWGGIGKSQIAIEYSYRIRDRNPDIWVFWLHAGHADLFTQAYIGIGSKVNISLKNDDPDSKNMKLVYDWLKLEVHEPWLIILDNADDVDMFYQNKSPEDNNRSFIDFLPRVSHGSILITSRDKMVTFDVIGAPDNNHHIIDVMMMTEDDALALLESRLPNSLLDDNGTRELLSLLGYVPLAITQACAYISRTPGASITKYLTLVKNGNNRVFKNGIVDHRRYTGISDAIFTTWAISFEQIRIQRPSSAEMLSLMSVLDRHSIPVSLLISYKEFRLKRTGFGGELTNFIKALRSLKGVDRQDQENANPALEAEVDKDLELLIGFSLIAIDTNDGTIQMHRLVQRATKDWLEDCHEFSIWQDRAIGLLVDVYPNGFQHKNYLLCRQLQVHVDKVLSYDARNYNILLGQSRLLHRSAWYAYRFIQDRPDALKRVEKAISIRKLAYTEPSPLMQECLLLKALCLIKLGNVTEGEALLYKVKWTQAKVWGFAHSSTLHTLENIAMVLSNQERHKEAEAVLEEILVVRRIKRPRDSYTDDAWIHLRVATTSLLWHEFADLTSDGQKVEDVNHTRQLSEEELEQLILRQLKYEQERPGWLRDLPMPVSEVISFLYQQEKFSEVVVMWEAIGRNYTSVRHLWHNKLLNEGTSAGQYEFTAEVDVAEEFMEAAAELMVNALIDANLTQVAWLWHDILGNQAQTAQERASRGLNQTASRMNELLKMDVLRREEYDDMTAVLRRRSSFYSCYKTSPQLSKDVHEEARWLLIRLAKIRAQQLRAAIIYYESQKRGPRVLTAYHKPDGGISNIYSSCDIELQETDDSSPPFRRDHIYTIEDIELLNFIETSTQFLIVVRKYISNAAGVEASLLIENNRTEDAEEHLRRAIKLQKDLAFGREFDQPIASLLCWHASNLHLQDKYQESALIILTIAAREHEMKAMQHDRQRQVRIKTDKVWIEAHIFQNKTAKGLHSVVSFCESTISCQDAVESFLGALRESLLTDTDLSSWYAIDIKSNLAALYIMCDQHTKAIPLLVEVIAVDAAEGVAVWKLEKQLEAARRISSEAKDGNSTGTSHFGPSIYATPCTACKRRYKRSFYCSICDHIQCSDCTAHGMWCNDQNHNMSLIHEDGRVWDDFSYWISFNNTEKAFSDIRMLESIQRIAPTLQPRRTNKTVDLRIEAVYWLIWISFATFWDIYHKKIVQNVKDKKQMSGKRVKPAILLRRHTT